MRTIVCSFVLICLSGIARAAISGEDLTAAAAFLELDYASVRGANDAVTDGAFYIAETGQTESATEDDAQNAARYLKVKLPVGHYRQVWIISEITGFGLVVRKAFVGPNEVFFWNDDLQSASHFSLHAELGQRGADRLMELPEEVVRGMFSTARRGTLQKSGIVDPRLIQDHTKSMDAFFRVALMRP